MSVKNKFYSGTIFYFVSLLLSPIIVLYRTINSKTRNEKFLTAVPFCLLMMSCKKTETITIIETIDLKRGLIAYYPFNGNANDTSGNNKNGTLVNGATFSTDAQNIENKAASFDGLNDYIQIADQTSSFAQDKMTISFQFYLRDASTRSTFLCKTNFITPTGVSWISSLTFGSVSNVDFKAAEPVSCSTQWMNNSFSNTRSNITIQGNRWYPVSIVYNYGLQIIYINGVYNAATVGNFSSLKKCNTADLYIGGWWKDDIISMNGKMDELRFYNRVLAENEIEELATEIN